MYNNQNKGSQVEESVMIQLKLVYWGPGESGKTTNYQKLRKKYHENQLSQGFSIETTDQRTLWQDSLYLGFDLELAGKQTRIIVQIVTATGQERFISTREYVVVGADGIIFVADSSPERIEENQRSFEELLRFAEGNNTPILIQLNKRDIPNAVSVEKFKSIMGLPKAEKNSYGHLYVYETEAINEKNIFDIFHAMVELMLFRFFK